MRVPPQIRIEVTRDANVVAVAAFGEIDLSTAPGVEERALAAAAAGSLSALILDLRGVTFLDSTGLRLLMALDGAARDAGYRFTVVRGPDVVHRVLEISGLTSVLEFVRDPADLL